MNKNVIKFSVIIIIAVVVMFFTIAYAEVNVTNTGEGKPKALDIYIGEFPYSSSIGGNISSASKEEVPNEFNVIKDDPKFDEPSWFNDTASEVPITPTPTATEAIPVDLGGVGASVCVMDDTTPVIVDFAYSSAGYKNEFKLSSPRSEPLGWSQGEMPNNRKGTAFGTNWSLGTFDIGTELIFSDTANGKTYFTGPASRNPDKLAHAAITFKNSGIHHRYLVSFEDYWNGGDKDYNDLEFYLSGNLSTGCTQGDTGSGAVIPVYTGKVCKCNSDYDDGKQFTCVAQFTYNSTVDNMVIPVHESSLPWNEFTGSGMVEQYRCQPTIFYLDTNSEKLKQVPFWTNRFWNNIKWKLGHDQSVLVKCEKSTPSCESLGYDSDDVCVDCKSNHK